MDFIRNHLNKLIVVFVCVFFLWLALITAWIGDDIIISLRQVFNAINGDGFTYNYNQRVQAFTHPSWVLLLTAVSWITNELFVTNIVISIVFSVLSIAVLLRINYGYLTNDQNRKNLMLVFIIFLGFSKAFTDYMTSGLENPLSFLLIGLIFLLLVKESKNKPSKLSEMFVFILLALAFLNRFDFAVLLAPLVIYLLFFRYGFKHSLKHAVPGIILITAWFTFAIIYFGAPFPNTFYAKLGTGYPKVEVYERGLNYFIVTYKNDPLTLLLMFLGFVAGIFSKNGLNRALSIGMLLYCLYIIKSGGDFMMGRFFAILAYISIFNISEFISSKHLSLSMFKFGTALSVVILTIGIAPIMSDSSYSNKQFELGVADERGYYFQGYGLFADRTKWPTPIPLPDKAPRNYIYNCGFLGTIAIKDPYTYHLDSCGLGDAFLSRLPAIQDPNWRIGHHHRKVPTNYGLSVVDSIPLADTELQPLLDDVTLAISGELFSVERFKAIYRLNVSKPYVFDKNKYQDPSIRLSESNQAREVNLVDLNSITSVPDGSQWNHRSHLVFIKNINVNVEDKRMMKGLNISLDHNDDYWVTINKTHRFKISSNSNVRTGVASHNINFSEPMVVEKVTIFAIRGDKKYSLAHLILTPADSDLGSINSAGIYSNYL